MFQLEVIVRFPCPDCGGRNLNLERREYSEREWPRQPFGNDLLAIYGVDRCSLHPAEHFLAWHVASYASSRARMR